MSDLQLVIPQKEDQFTRIKKFLSNDESGIVLNTKEEATLTRWICVNGMLSEKKYREADILQSIKTKFGVSIHTVRNDINHCYTLFTALTNDYKRYTLKHHIEDINIQIHRAENDKSLAYLLPKLYAEKTRAIAAMPVQMDNPNVPAPVVKVNTTVNIEVNLTAADALKEADNLIEFEKKHEYTDYEELKDDSPK